MLQISLLHLQKCQVYLAFGIHLFKLVMQCIMQQPQVYSPLLNFHSCVHILVSFYPIVPVHFAVDGHGAAIIGGTVGGVVGGGLCICLALCICITVCCCCYHKKKTQRRTATTATTATPMTAVQPTVAINQSSMQQTGQQDNNPPEYNLRYTSYPETYTQPSPYPPVAGGTLPPNYPPAGGTLPQSPPAYPSVGDGTLPPSYPAPGGTLPASYPPQSLDMPPPYPLAYPFYPPQ